MAKTNSAGKFSAFIFITPLFGVAAGYLITNDPMTRAFGVAALLMVAGLRTPAVPSGH
jgi:drug/metabolite transporter (DMT)-like permease